ncbi:MAG: hypothetical protein CMD83_15415 [Gammaproteobacteria bacterium]|nr:hypothetical protein [Gammaproteobacteria bacterium]
MFGHHGRMIGWIALGVVVLAVAFAGYRMSRMDDVNDRVVAEIRAKPNGARAAKTMILTLADGRVYPVNYLREDGYVYMGIDGRWWRAFVDTPQPVQMHIRGEDLTGNARTILDDPARKKDVFSRLRPTVPKWLPDFLNGKLVEITPTG